MTATLEEARAAKAALEARLGGHPAVNGIGIASEVQNDGEDEAEGYVLRVNLVEPTDGIPEEQDGVPVRTRVVGRIVAR